MKISVDDALERRVDIHGGLCSGRQRAFRSVARCMKTSHEVHVPFLPLSPQAEVNEAVVELLTTYESVTGGRSSRRRT